MELSPMHIVIDDTYGPANIEASKYVTGRRRTYVGVEIPDNQVEDVRKELRSCLAGLPDLIGIAPREFHFSDIYNRRGIWKNTAEGQNLKIFEFFAHIYGEYRWQTHIQTVDDRTLSDHGVKMRGKIDGINVTDRSG